MYRPEVVDSAMLMSACGRTVNVGLLPEGVPGVMEERSKGQMCIAFESVLSRKGR